METENQAPAIQESTRFVGSTEALGELFAALAAAQAEFAPVVKDSTAEVKMKAGGQYTFDYAGLDVIIAATTPALTKHGLAMMQFPTADEVLTVLAKGGARIESRCAITGWNDAQAFGSAITYFKRYARLSILSVFPANEDDDGGAAIGNKTTVTPRTRQTPPAAASKPAEPVKATPGALTPETKARIGDLAKRLKFNREELESESERLGCGKLESLNEAKGAVLAGALAAKLEQP